MTSLLDGLLQQMKGGTMHQVGQQLGVDDTKATGAVAAALPVLLGALARNARTDDGAAALARALDKDHDGSALTDLPGLLGSGGGAGAGILKHVLGAQETTVADGLGRSTGLDGSQAARLLAMLAPVVMGALGAAKRQNDLDPGGVASMLGEERSALSARSPGGVGSLLQFLDADKDGSVMDDLGGMLGKVFRK